MHVLKKSKINRLKKSKKLKFLKFLKFHQWQGEIKWTLEKIKNPKNSKIPKIPLIIKTKTNYSMPPVSRREWTSQIEKNSWNSSDDKNKNKVFNKCSGNRKIHKNP